MQGILVQCRGQWRISWPLKEMWTGYLRRVERGIESVDENEDFDYFRDS